MEGLHVAEEAMKRDLRNLTRRRYLHFLGGSLRVYASLHGIALDTRTARRSAVALQFEAFALKHARQLPVPTRRGLRGAVH